LIYAISPIHAATSVSAVMTRHPEADVSVTVVVHWPGAAAGLQSELTEIVREMLRPFSLVRAVVSFGQAQLDEILGLGRRAAVTRAIERALSLTNVDEIYYPHDVVGEMYQAIATTWPRARRICFGDALGSVYERRVHLGYLGIKSDQPSLLRRAAQRVMGLRRRRLQLEDFAPDEAALALPIDQSGKFLVGLPLAISSRETVSGVIAEFARACGPLHDYLRDLLGRYENRKKYLLLTENSAEGAFIDFDREIEMYCSVLEERCEPGSVVFLKSHPGEALPRNETIRERIGGKLEVVELDKRFRRYPIEIWRELVLASTVLCMSYPVLSLKYLYDVDVVQPMDDAFIERWFPEWTWPSYKNAISTYMLPLRALPAWNGKGVLWTPQLPAPHHG
jgi:hypothetical protein